MTDWVILPSNSVIHLLYVLTWYPFGEGAIAKALNKLKCETNFQKKLKPKDSEFGIGIKSLY